MVLLFGGNLWTQKDAGLNHRAFQNGLVAQGLFHACGPINSLEAIAVDQILIQDSTNSCLHADLRVS